MPSRNVMPCLLRSCRGCGQPPVTTGSMRRDGVAPPSTTRPLRGARGRLAVDGRERGARDVQPQPVARVAAACATWPRSTSNEAGSSPRPWRRRTPSAMGSARPSGRTSESVSTMSAVGDELPDMIVARTGPGEQRLAVRARAVERRARRARLAARLVEGSRPERRRVARTAARRRSGVGSAASTLKPQVVPARRDLHAGARRATGATSRRRCAGGHDGQVQPAVAARDEHAHRVRERCGHRRAARGRASAARCPAGPPRRAGPKSRSPEPERERQRRVIPRAHQQRRSRAGPPASSSWSANVPCANRSYQPPITSAGASWAPAAPAAQRRPTRRHRPRAPATPGSVRPSGRARELDGWSSMGRWSVPVPVGERRPEGCRVGDRCVARRQRAHQQRQVEREPERVARRRSSPRARRADRRPGSRPAARRAARARPGPGRSRSSSCPPWPRRRSTTAARRPTRWSRTPSAASPVNGSNVALRAEPAAHVLDHRDDTPRTPSASAFSWSPKAAALPRS